jgi:glutathionylspermidine synthase
MQRVTIEPRPNWQTTVESQGLHYHSDEERPYWDESAYYRFSPAQIDDLERATYRLNELCLQAVQHVVDRHRDLFPLFSIPEPFYPWILQSWERDEFTLYGRFDFAYDGQSPPKLLEYNADTPTTLLEASVIQWFWLQDVRPQLSGEPDQYNSLHERLIEAWKTYAPQVRGKLHFTTCRGYLEDFLTVSYLRDTAIQAGLQTEYLHVDDIRWDRRTGCFVQGIGAENQPGYYEAPIFHLFKLYPWEWLIREEFGQYLPEARTRWLEAPWKLLLSNKAILPILYQLDPRCPYLLPADYRPFGDSYVKKPTMAREGACVTLVEHGRTLAQTAGLEFYEQGPFVYQQLHRLPDFGGKYPVVGSWMINGWAAGIGIRESDTLITGNTSRFVPHVIAG